MSKLNEDCQFGFYYGGKLFPIDIEKEGYNLSSELFSFKDLKRSIIEHGKECYIEGYNKHIEHFNDFLVKNGYFSKDELKKILNEFALFQNKPPELTLESAEKLLKPRGIKQYDGEPRNLELNAVQVNIFNKYRQLTDEVHTLRIQKPRQQGVTTILEIIAQLESLNGKKVLYVGYDDSNLKIKKNNFTYMDARELDLYKTKLLGKTYDLIVIDELTSCNSALHTSMEINATMLTDSGRMILVATPTTPDESNYKELKAFFGLDIHGIKTYRIPPTIKEYEKAEKYPECRNEILGEFID